MPSLVYELNVLLRSLELSNRDLLSSPTDLTPTLLFTILSSLLPSLSSSLSTFDDDVQAMKVFLGVLETDVLRNGEDGCDISVCHVDPRKLAKGSEEECEYVGSVLVWLGKRLGLGLKPALQSTSQEEEEEESMVEDILAGLDASMDTDEDDYVGASIPSAPVRIDNVKKPVCIHDMSFSSPPRSSRLHRNKRPNLSHSTTLLTDNETSFEFFASAKRPKIRHDGWISLADERNELEEFEALHHHRISRPEEEVMYRPTTPPSPTPLPARALPVRPGAWRRVPSGMYTGEQFDILRTPQHRHQKASRSSARPPPPSVYPTISPTITQSPSDYDFNQRRSLDFNGSFLSEATSVRTNTLSQTLSDSALLDSTPRGSYARTLELLNRRATLLEEIAKRERLRKGRYLGT